MAWWLAAAALQGGQALFSGMEQRSAAQAANKQREEIAEAQYERALKEYEISWGQQLTQYAWDTAKVEAERFLDRRKEAQYNQQMGWLTESAIKNLQLNSEALYDKYVVEEGLRAKQEAINLDDTMLGLGNEQLTAMVDLQNQSAQTLNRAQQAQIEVTQQVAGYVNAVQQRALEASILVDDTENKAVELQTQLTLDQASDTIQRDIAMVAAIEESNRQRAIISARQGGGKTAVRASQNKLQELGRSYAELSLNRQRRGAQTAAFNSEMGVGAMQMSRIGLQMKSAVDSIKFSKASYGAKVAGLNLQQMGLQNRGQGLLSEYNRKSNTALTKFRELTIPSFDLAQRQGQREMAALKQKTLNTLREASMPYNKAIIFDPLKPIKGLKPEYNAPTAQYVPSMLGIGLNAAGAAFQGAMSMSAQGTDANGNPTRVFY